MESAYNFFPYVDTFALLLVMLCYLVCFEGAGLATDAYLKKLPTDFSLLGFIKARLGLVIGLSLGVATVQLLPLLDPITFSEENLISFTPFPYRDVIFMAVVSASAGVFLKLFGPTLFPMNSPKQGRIDCV